METPAPHAVYGTPPPVLGATLPGSIQYSPLMPGSAVIEEAREGTLAGMTILAPPATVERRYTLALAQRAMASHAPLTVLALKDKGGNRIAAELRAFGCDVDESSRQHYRICATKRPTSLTGVDEAINAGALQRLESGLWSQPGVFSWDRLDAGSALVLEHLPPLTGRGADLGCGIGILALAALASPAVTQLTLIDIDRRAVTAAERNVSDPRASFRWADVRHGIADLNGIDFVVMNPPFHDTGIEDQSLGQQFVERAAAMLRPGGICWLTANRHLPYERLMQKLFRAVTPQADANGFKIIMAEK